MSHAKRYRVQAFTGLSIYYVNGDVKLCLCQAEQVCSLMRKFFPLITFNVV